MKLKTAIAALGLASALSAPAFAQQPYFAIISKGFQHQFWQAVKSGAEQSAKKNGVTITFEAPETEAMIDKQIDMLNAAIAKKPQGLGFAALDSQAEVPLLKKAHEAGIPIVAFDSGVDSDLPLATCSTDNLKAAAAAADKMAEAVGKAGEIGMLVHDQTSQTGIQRRDGFKNQIESKYPDIKIVDIQYGGDPLVATESAKAMLAAHPEIKGIFASNEGSAIGLLQAARESKAKIIAIGFDSGKQQRAAIADGSEYGAITQNPVGIGECVVDSLAKAIKGEKLDKVIDTGFYWYDKSNLSDPKVSAVLYD
ncbi:ABC transporter substrate-binding protein [Rhizobium sp. 16-449-1b]|uniref:ABC transporter substrate-binding protein n=1 Tax=Rhizobium sp. 16-449-1b TaxID=2819989 RepID=UPI001ADA743B|nr:ABC transporter substrate-binding protein [Rhizobium sp. 16-449-1b]MBO9197655.1 ABC transporter substrate-binding protein [Rhizobium sp. 16-449-1b]